MADADPARLGLQEFLARQFDAGLAWVHFPCGSGGLGVSPQLQAIVDSTLADKGVRNPYREVGAGFMQAAAAIAMFGTIAQKKRHLRAIFTGVDIWCQLFSEPGAGSDLAGLATLAKRDGDDWFVTGQKVWTTHAHEAEWGLLVARTDPKVEKHKGLTYFIVSMHAPGIAVRPLRQMTGDTEFNEVFLTDVRVPDVNRIGGVGDGWKVSLATLTSERSEQTQRSRPRGGGPISDALRLWEEQTDHDPIRRHRLAQLWIEAEVQRLTSLRADLPSRTADGGPSGAIQKLAYTELNRRVYEFCVELLGPPATLYGPDARPWNAADEHCDNIQKAFLWSRALTIAAGTSEIMKNIVAERSLGLPGDVRCDKDRPWSDVPRNV